MMVEITRKQSEFYTAGEWERYARTSLIIKLIDFNQRRWAASQFLTSEGLAHVFGPTDANILSKYFQEYVQITGGVLTLHIAKLGQILGIDPYLL